jgi:hypothetical protein
LIPDGPERASGPISSYNVGFLGWRSNMTKLAMWVALAALSLGAPVHSAVADEVPTFDIRKNCKVDVQAYQGGGNPAGCMTDEQNARTALVSQWTQFEPESRARCTKMVGDIAGTQSYVELLTCLQMAKDVKSLPKD